MREDDKGRATSAGARPTPGDQSLRLAAEKIGSADRSNAMSAQDDERDESSVSPDMQQFIGRQLRAVYDDVAKQPVPDRFLELMKQLDNKTGVR